MTSELNEKNKSKGKPLFPIVGLSIQDMVDRLKDKTGGKSIMVAIFTIVHSLDIHPIPSPTYRYHLFDWFLILI